MQRGSYLKATGYERLESVAGSGEPHLVRTDLWSYQGHTTKSLVAFAQMTDLHIVDDQSPARLEWMDNFGDDGAPHFGSYPVAGAYRPHEYLSTQVVDAMCLAIARVGKGPRTGLPLQFTIVTGDAVDNQQYNETRWFIDLLDGGKLITPDSGAIGLDESFSNGSLDMQLVIGPNQQGTLVSNPGCDNRFYHPSINPVDFAGNEYARLGFPFIPGLLTLGTFVLGAARRPFTSHGLGMPWYSAYGNHDAMWQGNVPGNPSLIPLGDITKGQKWVGTQTELPDDYSDLGALTKLDSIASLVRQPVTADVNRRRLVSRLQFIQEHFTSSGFPVGHGFQSSTVDQAYYSIPSAATDLVQFIALDSVNADADITGQGNSDGWLDNAQFAWLEQQLLANSSRYIDANNRLVTQPGVTDKLFVLFSHHTSWTMDNITFNIPLGGVLPVATGVGGPAVVDLLLRFPNVIAWVNGHTHANKITPHARPSTAPVPGGFWEIATASHIDWPIQSRILEITASPEAHNTGLAETSPGPATLSIYTTMVDIAAPPAFGGDLSTTSQLASIARELATNDPQEVHLANPDPNISIQTRMGVPADRNTQLLLPAPFPINAPQPLGSPIAIARNPDGRLELFGTDASGNLWNTSQRTVSGDLQAWKMLQSGPGWQSVSASTHQDGRVEYFSIDSFDNVNRATQTTAGTSSYTSGWTAASRASPRSRTSGAACICSARPTTTPSTPGSRTPSTTTPRPPAGSPAGSSCRGARR